MVKIVIAGISDCPYYTKCELIGNYLAQNLANFKLHKIVLSKDEWDIWLQETCQKNNWSVNYSPLIWRELIDRGGKGKLIGNSNDFQEYAYKYYGYCSNMSSEELNTIANENFNVWNEIQEESKIIKVEHDLIKVCITDVANNALTYNLLPKIISSNIFGSGCKVDVILYGKEENVEILTGIEMELMDLAHPALHDVMITSSPKDAFGESDIIIFLDDLLCKEDEDHKTYLITCYELFSNYGRILNDFVKCEALILVVGDGLVNFNTWSILYNAPRIPEKNIVCLTGTIENDAKGILAKKLNVNAAQIADCIVWGDSQCNVVDLNISKIYRFDGSIWGSPTFALPLLEAIQDTKWLAKEFPNCVKERSAIIKNELKQRNANMQSEAVISLLKDWWNGTSYSKTRSLGVFSKGQYNLPSGVIFSMPVEFHPKEYRIVEDLTIDDEMRVTLDIIGQKLLMDIHIISETEMFVSHDDKSSKSKNDSNENLKSIPDISDSIDRKRRSPITENAHPLTMTTVLEKESAEL